jgi:hypothetical protein
MFLQGPIPVVDGLFVPVGLGIALGAMMSAVVSVASPVRLGRDRGDARGWWSSRL